VSVEAGKGDNLKKYIVNSDRSLDVAVAAVANAYAEKKYVTVKIDTGKARSVTQNAILHAWANEVAIAFGEETPGDIKCKVKLHIAMDILRAEDEQYEEACAKSIDYLTYEQKLSAMRIMPCTSLMNTKQLTRVLEAMQANYAQRGLNLTFPEDDK